MFYSDESVKDFHIKMMDSVDMVMHACNPGTWSGDRRSVLKVILSYEDT